MRTEADLRAAIDALADSAPADALARLSLPAPPSRSVHPGRWLALAAAIAVLVTAVGFGLAWRTRDVAPADRRVPGYWQMISRIDPPPGWQVVGRGIEGGSEYTELSRDGEQGRACSLVVYGRGQAKGVTSGGRPVRVKDRPGSYAAATQIEPARVTWAYDEDAYAQVLCLVGGSVAELTTLASAAEFDRPADLSLPFRLDALPAGYQPATVQSREEDGTTIAGVLLKRPGQPTIAVANAASTFDPPGPGLPGVEELQINGRPTSVREDQRALSIAAGDQYLRVSSYASDSQSWQPGEKENLLTVARGLQPADRLADPGTWFAARRALS